MYPIITGSEAYETHRDRFEADPARYQPPTAALLEAQRDRPAHEYLRALRAAQKLRHHVLERWRRTENLDALFTATTSIRSAPLGSDPADLRAPLLQLCIPFSVLGVPAISVPAPGDVGIGLQIVGLTAGTGGHGSHPAESAALAVALAVEGVGDN